MSTITPIRTTTPTTTPRAVRAPRPRVEMRWTVRATAGTAPALAARWVTVDDEAPDLRPAA